MPKGRKHGPEGEDTASCGVLSRIVAPVHRPAPTGSPSRSQFSAHSTMDRYEEVGLAFHVGPRRFPGQDVGPGEYGLPTLGGCPPADVEQDQRDRRTGVSYPVEGQAVGLAPVPAGPSCLRSDPGPVLPGTGGVRLRLPQHSGVAPLVHHVGHRHLGPGCRTRRCRRTPPRRPRAPGRRCEWCRRPGAGTGRAGDRSGYGVEQGRGSYGAALPVEAGGRNRPVPTWVRTGTLVRASASTSSILNSPAHRAFSVSQGRETKLKPKWDVHIVGPHRRSPPVGAQR